MKKKKKKILSHEVPFRVSFIDCATEFRCQFAYKKNRRWALEWNRVEVMK